MGIWEKNHGVSQHTSSSKKLVPYQTRNQYLESGHVGESTLFLERDCILLYPLLGLFSSSYFTNKVCCMYFMITLQRKKKPEVINLMGSITKILRTLQLTIFPSSLQRNFSIELLFIFFHFPNCKLCEIIFYF